MTPAETRLRRARGVADLLDSAFELPVVRKRVGFDSIVGLIPGYGDAIAAVCSFYIVYEALRAGVPMRTLLMMLGNIVVDTGLGSVPVVGDVFDVFWKANRRNVRLFERHVESN